MEEINALRTALEKPERPTAAVVGGAKVSTKIPVLTNLVAKVDKLIIGGGMANTFLQATGTMVGKSLAEPEFDATARDIMVEAKQKGCEIILPVDAVVAREFKEGAAQRGRCDRSNVPSDAMILDVGPQSVAHVVKALEDTKTLLWNGPIGRVRNCAFRRGHVRAGACCRGFDESGQARFCCRRRRYGRGLERGRA